MTALLIILTAAATIAYLLARHRAADLAAQRDELAAEADDLRGEVRCWKATAALNERAAHMLAEDNDRLRVEAETSLPRAPWPGEPLREKEIREAEARVLAIVAEKAPWELPLIEARRKRTGKIL